LLGALARGAHLRLAGFHKLFYPAGPKVLLLRGHWHFTQKIIRRVKEERRFAGGQQRWIYAFHTSLNFSYCRM
jgi:hypothetical protein